MRQQPKAAQPAGGFSRDGIATFRKQAPVDFPPIFFICIDCIGRIACYIAFRSSLPALVRRSEP
jgi:hypothetical protein